MSKRTSPCRPWRRRRSKWSVLSKVSAIAESESNPCPLIVTKEPIAPLDGDSRMEGTTEKEVDAELPNESFANIVFAP